MLDIIVKVADLYDKIKVVKEDDMQYVKIEYLEEHIESDGLRISPCLVFQATSDINTQEAHDYDYIDVCENIDF